MKKIVLLLAASTLAGCIFESDRSEAGYKDGYAVGYNTACEIRATLINAEWGNASYSEAYSDGVTNGIIDCLKSK